MCWSLAGSLYLKSAELALKKPELSEPTFGRNISEMQLRSRPSCLLLFATRGAAPNSRTAPLLPGDGEGTNENVFIEAHRYVAIQTEVCGIPIIVSLKSAELARKYPNQLDVLEM